MIFSLRAAAFAFAMGLSLVLPADLLAQETTDFNPLGRDVPLDQMERQLRIRVEWIELAHDKMAELMAPNEFANPHFLKSSNDGPLRKRLAELIREGEAKLLDTAVVIARSGQRAKSEAIYEYIYPTEYDPPEIATPTDGVSKTEKNDKGDKNAKQVSRDVPMTPPNATAFETRNVGTTLEIDPVLGADNQTIDLNLAPELVYAVDELTYGDFKIGDNEVTVKMPSFYSVRITTQVVVMAGEYLMIGTASPFEEKSGMPDRDRKIMVFVRANVLHTGLPLEMVPGSEQEKELEARTEGGQEQ